MNKNKLASRVFDVFILIIFGILCGMFIRDKMIFNKCMFKPHIIQFGEVDMYCNIKEVVDKNMYE